MKVPVLMFVLWNSSHATGNTTTKGTAYRVSSFMARLRQAVSARSASAKCKRGWIRGWVNATAYARSPSGCRSEARREGADTQSRAD
jgi:hypothetical protein